MPIHHQNIPVLPNRPRVRPIAGKIHRSYPVGRQNYSRACVGQILTLTITIDMETPFRSNIQANIITTMNAPDGKTWTSNSFHWVDSRTMICQVMAAKEGLHSFRSEFSFDNGDSWVRDTVADAWILVDPPQVDGLRLYTLIPNISGSLADWIADLKRISDMGFNAVHLLPLTTLDTSESPYAAKDLFNIDSRYLIQGCTESSISQLEAFVDAAKALNIKLCFDLVLNHVGVNSNIARQAPDWIVADPNQPDGFQRARYLSDQGWCCWDDLVLINYEHPSEAIREEIWAYMTSYMLFWAKYANATGGFVRFDNLHSSNPIFIQSLTETLHKVYPDVAILAEYFTEETTLSITGLQWGLNLNLATPWDYKFVPKLREYLKNIHRLSRHLRFFMPVTSHDSGSPAQEFSSVESTVPRYVAAALLGTGATGIVQGVEYGVEKKIEFIGRKSKMQFPAKPMFADFITRVNKILAAYPAFRRGENCFFVDNDHAAIIAAFRRETELNSTGLLVVCNFDILSPQHITIDLTHYLETTGSVTCCELLGEKTLTFEEPVLSLHLLPCVAQVFRFQSNK